MKQLVLVFGFFVSVNTLASNSSEIDKLFSVMGMSVLFQDSVEQVVEFEIQKNPSLGPYKNTMLEFFEKYMSFDSLKPQFSKIYTDTFTEKEIIEIRQFYETPTGKKTLVETPVLLRKGMEIGQRAVQENLTELTDMIEKEAKRIESLQQGQ